eukprot:scaffold2482_cov166-Amphora_coffeaeformis.AAC.4
MDKHIFSQRCSKIQCGDGKATQSVELTANRKEEASRTRNKKSSGLRVVGDGVKIPVQTSGYCVDEEYGPKLGIFSKGFGL